MSGGSYNYIYSRLRTECAGYMHDEEMNDLINEISFVNEINELLNDYQHCIDYTISLLYKAVFKVSKDFTGPL